MFLSLATRYALSVSAHLPVTGDIVVERSDVVDRTGDITLHRAGRLHHSGLGRALAGTPVVLIIEDLDIRVINTTTGELLRHLQLDPNRNYQPQQNNKNPNH